jgi:hypothetical protein
MSCIPPVTNQPDTVVVLRLLVRLGPSLLGELLVVLLRVVGIDVAIARAGDGVDGALALLEAGGGDFGGIW